MLRVQSSLLHYAEHFCIVIHFFTLPRLFWFGTCPLYCHWLHPLFVFTTIACFLFALFVTLFRAMFSVYLPVFSKVFVVYWLADLYLCIVSDFDWCCGFVFLLFQSNHPLLTQSQLQWMNAAGRWEWSYAKKPMPGFNSVKFPLVL